MSELVDLGVVDKRLAGLERPASTGLTSGLARALAQKLDFDVVLVRVALVFLAVFTGIGLAVYVWGTLLTPRVGKEAPIHRLVPGFRQLNRTTQLLMIAGSTVLLGLVWGAGSAGTGLAIAGIAVTAWWLITRKSTGLAVAPEPAPEPEPEPVAPEPDETYEQWQSRMQGAVDPYPMATLPVATAAPAAVKRGWWGGLGILVAGGLTMGTLLFVGIGSPTTVASAGLVVMGLLLVLWALIRRSRRIPGFVLVLCLILAAGTALVGSGGFQAQTVAGAPLADEGAEYDYVNTRDVELDLGHLTQGRVTVNVVMSQVTLVIPPGATYEINQFGSEVELPPVVVGEAEGLIIEINAVGSQVTGVQS